MSMGNAFPVRSTIPDVVNCQGVWTGGGAGTSCSHVATDWNRGITAITYVSTGIYDIFFQDVGQQIVGHHIGFGQATTVDPLTYHIVNGSFSTATKSVRVEFGATLIDLLTTDKLYVCFEFAKNGP